MDLRVGNGAKVVALTVETYYFTLSNGFILELDTFYFVLVFSRNIISISYVALNRFKFIIERKYCSFYNNRVFFFMDMVIIQMVGIYLILKCSCSK